MKRASPAIHTRALPVPRPKRGGVRDLHHRPAGYNFYLKPVSDVPFRLPAFVGADNFRYLLQQDDLFWRAIWNIASSWSAT